MKRSDLFWGLIQLFADAVAILSAFLLAYSLRRFTWDIMPTAGVMGYRDFLWLALAALPVWLVIFGITGLYHHSNLRKGIGGFNNIFIAVSAGTMFVVAAIFLSRELFFSRLVVVYIWLFALFLVLFERCLLHALRKKFWQWGIGINHVIVVGSNDVACALVQKITQRKNLGYRIKGIISDNSFKKTKKTDSFLLGNIKNLQEILRIERPDEVIVATSKLKNDEIFNLILESGMVGYDVKFVPEAQALLTSYVVQEEMAGVPVLLLKDSPLFGWGRVAKRIIDVIVSSLLLLILALPMGLVALIIKISSPGGPVLYKQERVGLRNKTFCLLKFRSMIPEAEAKTGPVWTTPDDKRRTPFGKFIRRTSIDELPQLFNVLKGDMSLIGPRPERPVFVEEFGKKIPHYWYRHKVRPGLTSWAIVNGFRGNTSIEERTKYDLFYIENWSLIFDLKIALRTLWIIIKGVEAY